MRAILAATVLALAGCQLQEPTVPGTVVAVAEAPQLYKLEESAKYYEDPLLPEVAWKVEVQLGNGAEVIVLHTGPRRYEPGERVRLLIDDDGALLL